ncbi:hypothetical protein CGZ80_11225 [Rhodopirellula sp. MGV]|nr:hypothetical protein CGZ80_11225 [Rhodopirellula sp. MGV]PNY37058.1 hypothetical protein C2E31_09755 [Rhodopirellula baltica]
MYPDFHDSVLQQNGIPFLPHLIGRSPFPTEAAVRQRRRMRYTDSALISFKAVNETPKLQPQYHKGQ